MRLFREGTRQNFKPIQPDQTKFAWLDEAAKAGADEARQQMQAAFDQIPADKQAGLAHRLRQDGPDHSAAVVELFTHEMLRQCGFQIEVEPVTPAGSCPDFLIRAGSFSAYVEVTVDLGPAASNRARRALADLMTVVNRQMKATGFGVFVDSFEAGDRDVPPRRLTAFLDRWFKALDHKAERAKLARDGLQSMARTTFSDEGWTIDLRLWPLEDATRRPDQLAGQTIETAWSEAKARLAANLKGKLQQHRGCQLPIVVVVAGNDMMHEPDYADIVDVLYGTAAEVDWSKMPPGDFGVGQATGDTIWVDANPSRNQDLAGVVTVNGVYPWTFSRVMPELWDNPHLSEHRRVRPWIFRRLRWNLTQCPEVKFVEGSQQQQLMFPPPMQEERGG